MGIAYILKDHTDNLWFWFPTYIGIHLLLMFYFAFIHGLIFKNSRQDGGKAVVLNLIGIGIGQAYNRQFIKGIVFLAIFLISILGYPIRVIFKR